MAKKDQFKEALSQLGAKFKEEPISTPIQEVRPVESHHIAGVAPATKTPNQKQVNNTSETHVNFWAPTDLVQRLKIHSVRSGKSIKQIIIEALEVALSPH